jgi:DnaK suppressor protein
MTATQASTSGIDAGHLSEALLIRLRDRLFIECSQLAAESDEHRATLAQLAERSDAGSLLEAEGLTAEIARCGDSIIDTFQALLRLDAGTYGLCEHCGGPIPSTRLEAMPRVRGCGACVPHLTPKLGSHTLAASGPAGDRSPGPLAARPHRMAHEGVTGHAARSSPAVPH